MTAPTVGKPPGTNSTPSSDKELEQARYQSFADRIIEICRDDSGRRAALRRGLGRSPDHAVTMHAVVVPRIPVGISADLERAYYTIAALIAAQPTRERRRDSEPTDDTPSPVNTSEAATPNEGAAEPATAGEQRTPSETNPRSNMANQRDGLGVSLARAVCQADPQRRMIAQASAERRLHLLVRQSRDGVHRHLPGVVRQIQSAGVAIDWAQLIYDLCRWTSGRDWVAKRWLQSFYQTLPSPDPNNPNPKDKE